MGEYVTGGTLNLNWKDCGDSTYHGKVTSVTPSQLTLGQKTHMSGSGNLDETVNAGSGTITTKAGPLTDHHSVDLCSAKTISLPLGLGSVQWNGLPCPVAAGAVDVGVDIQLSSAIPASFAKATVDVNAVTDTGDNLLCMEINTSPATGVTAAEEEYVTGATLNLNWRDCGDSTYHGKVTSVTPSQLTLGQQTHMSGSGNLDETVNAGSGTIVVKAGPITENYSVDVCSAKTISFPLGLGSVQWDGLSCPVAAGTVDVGVDIQLSSAIPASLAKATVDV